MVVKTIIPGQIVGHPGDLDIASIFESPSPTADIAPDPQRFKPPSRDVPSGHCGRDFMPATRPIKPLIHVSVSAARGQPQQG